MRAVSSSVCLILNLPFSESSRGASQRGKLAEVPVLRWTAWILFQPPRGIFFPSWPRVSTMLSRIWSEECRLRSANLIVRQLPLPILSVVFPIVRSSSAFSLSPFVTSTGIGSLFVLKNFAPNSPGNVPITRSSARNRAWLLSSNRRAS